MAPADPSGRTNATPESTSTRAGDYELLAEISKDDVGTLFLARPIAASRPDRGVAVYRCRSDLSADTEFKRLFVSELSSLGGISHPNVVSPREVLEEECLSVVTDLVDGVSFAELLSVVRDRSERLSVSVVLTIVTDVLAGLYAAHRTFGVIHGGLSPNGVFVGSDGVARISDFGIARARSHAAASSERPVNEFVAYKAPEQFSGYIDSPTVDQYAVAEILWEALVGRARFSGGPVAASLKGRADVVGPGSVVPAVTGMLDELVIRGLSLSPSNRFESCEDFGVLLSNCGVPLASKLEVAKLVTAATGDVLAKRNANFAAMLEPAKARGTEANAGGPPKRPSIAAPSSPLRGTSIVPIPKAPPMPSISPAGVSAPIASQPATRSAMRGATLPGIARASILPGAQQQVSVAQKQSRSTIAPARTVSPEPAVPAVAPAAPRVAPADTSSTATALTDSAATAMSRSAAVAQRPVEAPAAKPVAPVASHDLAVKTALSALRGNTLVPPLTPPPTPTEVIVATVAPTPQPPVAPAVSPSKTRLAVAPAVAPSMQPPVAPLTSSTTEIAVAHVVTPEVAKNEIAVAPVAPAMKTEIAVTPVIAAPKTEIAVAPQPNGANRLPPAFSAPTAPISNGSPTGPREPALDPRPTAPIENRSARAAAARPGISTVVLPAVTPAASTRVPSLTPERDRRPLYLVGAALLVGLIVIGISTLSRSSNGSVHATPSAVGQASNPTTTVAHAAQPAVQGATAGTAPTIAPDPTGSQSDEPTAAARSNARPAPGGVRRTPVGEPVNARPEDNTTVVPAAPPPRRRREYRPGTV